MTELKNVDGHFYPPFHRGWGGFAEELFHYTSRYYASTEAFVRHLAQDREFRMSGYKAADLSTEQRDLMASVLACGPDEEAALTVIGIVSAVLRQDPGVQQTWTDRYKGRLGVTPAKDGLADRSHLHLDDAGVSPLDPFMNIAERLQMPVAVREHHVEVSLHALAGHLDSANSTLRANLHNAVVRLHNAGYLLRNHPHLTHSEAHEIADEDAV